MNRTSSISTLLLAGGVALLIPAGLSGQSNTSVLAYGAVADGILRTDGTMAAGSAVLSSPSAFFTTTDVGKYVQVIGAGPGSTSNSGGVMNASSPVLNSASGSFASSDVGRGMVVIGAGPGGTNLVTTIQTYNSPSSVVLTSAAQNSVANATYYYGAMTLEGTIQSVQNTTTITLSTPALATISEATYAYGTDDHAAFQAALDAVGQAGGGTVSVPAPTSCPGGAVCGYVVKASDQTTSVAPGAVKIRYNNVSLIGGATQSNLFCRGAYGIYTNSPAFPGTTGIIRGFCINVGDNGGPNGAAGEAVSNVTIENLHLYGMTNGNTFNVSFGYPLDTPSGDGWDITHKGIYMWDNSSFSNITINSVIIQDFKAENIYSGGSVITGMVISNSTLTNYNGNGISMLAADLQVLNNTISNGSNAAVENSTVSAGGAALVRQLYQGNTISQMEREGIVVVGVDGGVASGSVQITSNYFDTIGQVHGAGTQSAIYVASQNNFVPPANVTVTGNTCHDCYTFGTFVTSGNSVVQGNAFTVDRYNACCVLPFMYPLTGLTIANNTGSLTSYAQANGLSIGAVYMINPGYATGGFAWKNVVLKGNTWTFAGVPQYQFVTTSGLGWQLVTLDNLNWQGDVCNGCTHGDVNHGLVNLAQTTTIEPYGPTVYVNGNSSAVTATVDAQKQEDGSQIQIVNAGGSAVVFASDNNLSLASPITLPGGSNSSVNFVYHASLGKWTSGSTTAASIVATAGTPQSATVNTAFATALQAMVKDANGNPLSGVTVTFTAPASGASATFGGSANATAVTNASGVATATGSDSEQPDRELYGYGKRGGRSHPGQFQLDECGRCSGEHRGDGGDTAERERKYGLCHRPAGDGEGCWRQSAERGSGDVRRPGERLQRNVQRIVECDRAYQCQRRGDGADSDGQWPGGGLYGYGTRGGRSHPGQFQPDEPCRGPGEHRGDGGNAAERERKYGLCHRSAGDGEGCWRQSAERGSGDVHRPGERLQRDVQRIIECDCAYQYQRRGDGTDSDGQWPGGGLYGYGKRGGRSHPGQLQPDQHGGGHRRREPDGVRQQCQHCGQPDPGGHERLGALGRHGAEPQERGKCADQQLRGGRVGTGMDI